MKFQLENTKGHIRSLDGLRGLAILLVLVYHIFPYVKVFQVGWIGVDLFFVLSGFLITGILLDTVHHKNYWKNFIGRRILRIFPLYYFTILLFVGIALLSPAFATHEGVRFDYFARNQAWFWSYLMNWKIQQEGSWLPIEIFNIFWSLAIEEQFYIFWPFVVLLFRNRIYLVIVLVLVSVIFFRTYLVLGEVWTETSVYTNTLTRIDTLLMGALLAFAIRKDTWRQFLEKYTLYLLVVAILLFLVAQFFARGFHPYHKYMLMYGYTFNYLFFAGLLIIVVQKGKPLAFVRKIFENRVLIFFGKYSYAMYVFHWAFFVLLYDSLVHYFSSIISYDEGSKLISSTAIFLLVVLASQVSWYGLERHFLKIKRYFKY